MHINRLRIVIVADVECAIADDECGRVFRVRADAAAAGEIEGRVFNNPLVE